MSGARVVAGADALDTALNWVLPLNEALSEPNPLDAVAVYARPEALVGNAGALSALPARGATTLVVDGPIPPDTVHSGLPPGMVIIEMGLPVGFAALNRLLAERALSQEVHVMRYSTHVHASLAGLFHRARGFRRSSERYPTWHAIRPSPSTPADMWWRTTDCPRTHWPRWPSR